MGKLIYNITTTLDGYVADSNSNFDWAEPSEEVLTFVNKVLGNVGIFLFGRSLYETMAVWDTWPTDEPSEAINNFVKIWQRAEKIVYSTTLSEVPTKNTKLEHTFDPHAIRQLKEQSVMDLAIGGPHLAAAAMKANLIDEYHQTIVPIVIGEGNSWLPPSLSLKMQLVNVQRFENGSVHLHYKPTESRG